MGTTTRNVELRRFSPIYQEAIEVVGAPACYLIAGEQPFWSDWGVSISRQIGRTSDVVYPSSLLVLSRSSRVGSL